MYSPSRLEVSNTMSTQQLQRSRKPASKKRGKKGLATMNFQSFGNPYPIHADVEFTYVDRIAIDAGGSGAVGVYQFAANGMYDPDITGTGHQPLGFDQWLGTSITTGFYNHYNVTSSHIKVTAFSQAADNTGQAIVLLGLSDDTTVGIDFNTALENPTYKRVLLGSVGSGHDVVTIDKGFDAASMFGLTQESLYAKEDLMGTYSTNPSELTYYTIYVSSNSSSGNPANVWFLVEIKYRAHLTERKELQAS